MTFLTAVPPWLMATVIPAAVILLIVAVILLLTDSTYDPPEYQPSVYLPLDEAPTLVLARVIERPAQPKPATVLIVDGHLGVMVASLSEPGTPIFDRLAARQAVRALAGSSLLGLEAGT